MRYTQLGRRGHPIWGGIVPHRGREPSGPVRSVIRAGIEPATMVVVDGFGGPAASLGMGVPRARVGGGSLRPGRMTVA